MIVLMFMSMVVVVIVVIVSKYHHSSLHNWVCNDVSGMTVTSTTSTTANWHKERIPSMSATVMTAFA